METQANYTDSADYPCYEDYGNMPNTYTDYEWLIGGPANARADPGQQCGSTSALTADVRSAELRSVTPMESDTQNPQIVAYSERSGTDQRPYQPSDLGSTLVPLNNQSLAPHTSHAISWSPDSLIQLTSCNPCDHTPYTPIDKLGDYPVQVQEIEQRIAVEGDERSQQCDAYLTSTEGSLEGYNILSAMYNVVVMIKEKEEMSTVLRAIAGNAG
uniref:Uncharacterized protein n=1 Tax=Glossina austeni TaxID=7395 RepID=A0A1A9VLP4_GLOAU